VLQVLKIHNSIYSPKTENSIASILAQSVNLPFHTFALH